MGKSAPLTVVVESERELDLDIAVALNPLPRAGRALIILIRGGGDGDRAAGRHFFLADCRLPEIGDGAAATSHVRASSRCAAIAAVAGRAVAGAPAESSG